MKRCVLLIVMVGISQAVLADADCDQFGFCFVCTFTDDFTDEVSSHELQCSGSDAFSNIEAFLQPGRIVVGCFPNNVAYVGLTKMKVEQLPDGYYAQVRLRFDKEAAYIGEWPTRNLIAQDHPVAFTLDRDLTYSIASSAYQAERLLYEIDGVKGVVSFSQPDTQNAVLELQSRCGEDEE